MPMTNSLPADQGDGLHIGFAHIWEIDSLWPLIRDGMERAIAKSGSDYRLGQLWQMLRTGNAYLMIVHDASGMLFAGIWRFVTHEGVFCFECVMAFGTQMRRWLRPALNWITETARREQAAALIATGRLGWERLFDAPLVGNQWMMRI